MHRLWLGLGLCMKRAYYTGILSPRIYLLRIIWLRLLILGLRGWMRRRSWGLLLGLRCSRRPSCLRYPFRQKNSLIPRPSLPTRKSRIYGPWDWCFTWCSTIKKTTTNKANACGTACRGAVGTQGRSSRTFKHNLCYSKRQTSLCISNK